MELMVCNYLIVASISALSMHGYADEPHSVGLENMASLLRGDVRLIAMGDSYSAPFYGRVPMAGLRVWPITNISAMGGGASESGHLMEADTYCSPVSLIQSSDEFGYQIERNSQDLFFALPLRGLHEMYTSSLFDDGGTNRLFSLQCNPTGFTYLSSGVHGRFAEPKEDVAFRFLYRCPATLDLQVEELRILNGVVSVGVLQLQDGARKLWYLGENPTSGSRLAVPRQINASSTDYPAQYDENLRMYFEQLDPLAGTNQYFDPAGCVYYHRDISGLPERGLYYNYLADESWSYTGFGSNTECTGTHDKKFSLEQFTYWLDVTTLHRDQPTLFFWYFAPEILSYTVALTRMTAMIDQADQAAELVGLDSVEHLIVISHMLNLSGDEEQDRIYILNQQNAAFELASTRPSVSAASIYEATDGTMFTGDDGISWLLNHGFDHFEFGSNTIDLVDITKGNLLDESNVHPKDPNSAAFFAAILGDIIRENGCPADIVSDGIINVNDLLAIISHFGEIGGVGDINNDGVVNVTDLLLVINGWGECWPVQAPFNTPLFRSMQSGRIPEHTLLPRDSRVQNESRSRGAVDR